jgi:hypothetical protein
LRENISDLIQYSEFLTFLTPTSHFRKKRFNIKKHIFKFDLRILSAFQIYLKYCKVPLPYPEAEADPDPDAEPDPGAEPYALLNADPEQD